MICRPHTIFFQINREAIRSTVFSPSPPRRIRSSRSRIAIVIIGPPQTHFHIHIHFHNHSYTRQASASPFSHGAEMKRTSTHSRKGNVSLSFSQPNRTQHSWTELDFETAWLAYSLAQAQITITISLPLKKINFRLSLFCKLVKALVYLTIINVNIYLALSSLIFLKEICCSLLTDIRRARTTSTTPYFPSRPYL